MQNSTFTPLEQAPQAITLTVRSLLQRVQQGKIRIPSFQRPLRWRADDVVKLFDSIQRGYPVGALLLWKNDAEADSEYRIANITFPVGAESEAWWIVDGQQRITALAAALLEWESELDPRWLVKFDPERNLFISGPLKQGEEGKVVPLSILGDLRRLGKWLANSSLSDDLLDRIEDMQQRVLDYELSAYVLETTRPEALEAVFARVNSSGVRMRSDEVFQALFGQTRATGDGVDLNVLQQDCDIDSFGEPPRSEVLKAVLAISGHDPTQRLEALGEQALSQLVGMREASAALSRAIQFIQASPDDLEPGAGIPAYSLLPYPIVFVILARWFHFYPDSSVDTRRLLAQWLWRGAITGVHQRAAVSKMRDQVRLIQGKSELTELDSLLNAVNQPLRVDWELQSFNARSASSRVEILAFLTLKPRDRLGPVSWRALLSGGQRIAREVIRSSKEKELSQEEARLSKTAANRVLLDSVATGLDAELRRWNPEEELSSLESHLIDHEMWRDLSEGRLGRFLRRRAARVQTLVSRFLSSRAGLGAPFVASVSRYTDEDGELDEESAGLNGVGEMRWENEKSNGFALPAEVDE